MNRRSSEDVKGSESTLLSTVMMGNVSLCICPNPQNVQYQERPSCKLYTSGVGNMST